MSPRAVEIAYYSELLASLIVSAARTDDPAYLSRLRTELVEAFNDVLTLLSHDALLMRPASADLSEVLSALAARAGQIPEEAIV